MHCLTISPASSSGTATFPSMRSVDGGAATGFAARGGAGHRGRPREGSGAATEAWRGPAAACNQGVKSMAKDEARIIRASDVPLTRRPKFWPPEPFQMECPSDWRRGVVVAWSSEPSPGYCYLQLLGTDRAVTVAGHRVMFGGRNAPQRAIRPIGLWHRRRARWRTVYEMLERKEAA